MPRPRNTGLLSFDVQELVSFLTLLAAERHVTVVRVALAVVLPRRHDELRRVCLGSVACFGASHDSIVFSDRSIIDRIRALSLLVNDLVDDRRLTYDASSLRL
jgi:hypothetical protein